MPYPAPSIPDTPSSSINQVLTKHFTGPPDNALKAVVAHFVCAQFNSILLAYRALKRGASTDSYQMWAVACALVSLTLALASFIVYKIILASTFLLYGALRYGLGSLALLGVAMGAAGVLFYDKRDDDVTAAAAAARVADQKLGYKETSNKTYSKTFLETEIDKTE